MTANLYLKLNDKTRASQLKKEMKDHSLRKRVINKRHKESFIEEESSTASYSDTLHISATTKPSKVVVKKYTPGQQQVYAQIYSKQDKNAFHLDHIMQDLGEEPSQVMVDEENFKPCAAISSAGL